MRTKLLTIACLSLLVPALVQAAFFIPASDGTFDVGTPDSNWPCKVIGYTGAFNGWYGPGEYALAEDGLQNTPAGGSHTPQGSKSLYRYRYAQESDGGCNIVYDSYTPPGSSTVVYFRFYALFTSHWDTTALDNTFDMNHMWFMGSQYANSSIQINILSSYQCGGKPSKYFSWDIAGQQGQMWWLCGPNLAPYINEWHSWEFAFDRVNSNVKIYLDGVLFQDYTWSGRYGTSPAFPYVALSAWSNGTPNFIGDFYIDNVVMSDSYIGPASEGGDTTAPTVTAFTIPSTSTSRTVSVSTFTATDDTAVTGYCVNESATPPTSASCSGSGWAGTAQSQYVFTTDGNKTLYAWAKDAANNISSSLNDGVLVDTVFPTLSTVVIGTNGTSWTFTYSEAVTCTSTPNCCDDFVVSMSSQGAITLSYSSGSGTTSVVCTGNKTVRANETVSSGLNYTTVANGIEDAVGNDLASFTGKAVTNSSIVPFAPVLIDVEGH